MDFLDATLLQQGGLMMWPLLALSLIGLILFVERTFYLHRGQIKAEDFLTGVQNLLRKRRLVEALTICEETPGPVARLTKAALVNYNQPEPALRGAVQAAALVEIPLLERRIATLGALSRVAPLLGLLGTVLGLVKAFFALQREGAYAHMGVLSAGFGEALLSTAFGLCIAVLAYLAHHFLTGRVRAVVQDMEWAGNEILQFLLRGLPEEDSAPAEEPQEEPAPPR